MTDTQIARLFEHRDRLERELALVNARIAASRREYADRNGMLVLPRVEAFRQAVSG